MPTFSKIVALLALLAMSAAVYADGIHTPGKTNVGEQPKKGPKGR